jgi:hypothetical protein
MKVNSIYQLKYNATLITEDFNSTNQSPLTLRDIIDCPLLLNMTCQDIINCNTANPNCNFTILFRKNLKLYSNVEIRFSIEPLTTVYFQTQLLSVTVNPTLDTATLYLKSNSKYTSLVGFNRASLFVVHNRLMVNARLKLQRLGNLNETVKVFFTTRDLSNLYKSFYWNNLLYYSANSGYDYEPAYGYLTFMSGESEKFLNIELRSMSMLLPMDIEAGPNSMGSGVNHSQIDQINANKAFYPRLFQVLLLNCTPSCAVEAKSWISNVTVVNEHVSLWRMYKQILNDEFELPGLQEVDATASSATKMISRVELDLIAETIQRIQTQQFSLINNKPFFSKNQPLILWRQNRLVNILCNLLWSKSTDYAFNLKLSAMLEDMFFSMIGGTSGTCHSDVKALNFKRLECQYSAFYYACGRFNFTNYSRFDADISYLGNLKNNYLKIGRIFNFSIFDLLIHKSFQYCVTNFFVIVAFG